MAVRSSLARPVLDSEDPAVTFDFRLRELVDHVAVDLAEQFLGVPQPAVPATPACDPDSRKEH